MKYHPIVLKGFAIRVLSAKKNNDDRYKELMMHMMHYTQSSESVIIGEITKLASYED